MSIIRRLFGGSPEPRDSEYTVGPSADESERRTNFKARAVTNNRLLKRSCESLIGMTGGMLADGHLADDEIHFLNVWLNDNPRSVIISSRSL